MTGFPIEPSRRSFLGGAATAGGALLAGASPALSRSGRRLDLGDPQAALDAYIKLRGSTAAETTYVAYDGDIFGVLINGDSIPLVGFRGIAKSHWRPDGQGGYINRDYDVGVLVDHRTGVILKTWHNPLTSTEVEVIHYVSGPSGGHFKPGLGADDPYGSGVGRWGQSGDLVWQTNATVLSWPNVLSEKLHPLAWSGDKVHSSMSTTYTGPLSEVLDPAVRKVGSTLAWNDILSPSPWMRMGRLPVMCDWRMIGGKVRSAAALDPKLVAEVESVFPGYISRDAVWTERSGGWNQYLQRYPKGEKAA
jgi:hypothetical protein